MNIDFLEIAYKLAVMFLPFLFALSVHEFAHGWVAKLKGDRTAEQLGRLTINPMAHADPIGTFALPIMSIVFGSPIFFGWAKPVPVDPRYLSKPRSDMFWIALAGPLSNVIMAVLAAGVMGLLVLQFGNLVALPAVVKFMNAFILINLFLAVFNMIPVHPLDGGKVLARFLPHQWNDWLERNEMTTSLVLFALILTGALAILRFPVMWMHSFLTSWIV
ncbi:MAG: site-2 protease family protein [Bdellovibrionales bacterium]